MRDEILSGIGLLLLAFGSGLVAGVVVAPVAGAGLFAAVLGAGILVYALFLTPNPPDRPEVS